MSRVRKDDSDELRQLAFRNTWVTDIDEARRVEGILREEIAIQRRKKDFQKVYKMFFVKCAELDRVESEEEHYKKYFHEEEDGKFLEEVQAQIVKIRSKIDAEPEMDPSILEMHLINLTLLFFQDAVRKNCFSVVKKIISDPVVGTALGDDVVPELNLLIDKGNFEMAEVVIDGSIKHLEKQGTRDYFLIAALAVKKFEMRLSRPEELLEEEVVEWKKYFCDREVTLTEKGFVNGSNKPVTDFIRDNFCVKDAAKKEAALRNLFENLLVLVPCFVVPAAAGGAPSAAPSGARGEGAGAGARGGGGGEGRA